MPILNCADKMPHCLLVSAGTVGCEPDQECSGHEETVDMWTAAARGQVTASLLTYCHFGDKVALSVKDHLFCARVTHSGSGAQHHASTTRCSRPRPCSAKNFSKPPIAFHK